MADLTQNERELLAVVKFFNANVKKIDRMVVKLVNNLGVESAALLTGYTENTVKAIVADFKLENAKRKITLKNSEGEKLPSDLSTVKPKRKFRTKTERLLAEEPITEMVDEELAKQGETRLAIHINAESDVATRIAYDVAKAIESELQPGDRLWKNKELNERFGSNTNNAPTVRRILIDHNWIQPVDESNPRMGYVVK